MDWFKNQKIKEELNALPPQEMIGTDDLMQEETKLNMALKTYDKMFAAGLETPEKVKIILDFYNNQIGAPFEKIRTAVNSQKKVITDSLLAKQDLEISELQNTHFELEAENLRKLLVSVQALGEEINSRYEILKNILES